MVVMLLANGLAQTKMSNRAVIITCLLIPVTTTPMTASAVTDNIKDMGVVLWPVLISFNGRKPSILWTQMHF